METDLCVKMVPCRRWKTKNCTWIPSIFQIFIFNKKPITSLMMFIQFTVNTSTWYNNLLYIVHEHGILMYNNNWCGSPQCWYTIFIYNNSNLQWIFIKHFFQVKYDRISRNIHWEHASVNCFTARHLLQYVRSTLYNKGISRNDNSLQTAANSTNR